MLKSYVFDPNIKAKICQNLKIARNIAGIRLEDAAEIFGITPEHLKRIEAINDRNNMSINMLHKAIIVYGMDADFFFNEPSENRKKLEE